jgi:DNA polymerase-3 subunit epsilon
MREVSSRQDALEFTKEKLKHEPLYLDTETTGLGPNDEIVEVSLLDTQGEILVDSLVKPTRSIPRDAITIHGITDEMVADAPTWEQVWPSVEAQISGNEVAIYNADFDLRMMRQSHNIHKMVWNVEESKFFCIMILYAAFNGEWDFKRGSFRWQSLERARAQLSLPLANTHRAKDDALLARSVLLAIAAG